MILVSDMSKAEREAICSDPNCRSHGELNHLRAEVERLQEDVSQRRGEHDGGWFWSQSEWADWSNKIALLLPEEYEGDEAQEAIIERAVRDLCERVRNAEGALADIQRHIDQLKARLAEVRGES